MLLAALVRGLVDTAALQWRAGVAAQQVSATLLQIAAWRAARSGLHGDLLDPALGLPRPAGEVVEDLVLYVGRALADSGDEALRKRQGSGNVRAQEPVLLCGAATGLDSADPRWRR